MAILSTKAILVAGAGIALIGGAWALSGSSGSTNSNPENTAGNAEIKGARPALHPALQKSGLKMNINITEGRNRAVGELILSNNLFKGFGSDTEFGGAGGTESNTALDSAGVSSNKPVELDNVNDDREVIYDIANNHRILVDHVRKQIRKATIVDKPKVPFGMGDGKVSENGTPEQEAALRGLFGKMTKARLDPKREIKLGDATGETGSARVNNIMINCAWITILRAGGPIGKICSVPDSKMPLAVDIRGTISNMPLAGAGKNDFLSLLRQIVEIQQNSLPLKIRFEDEENPDNFKEWEIERTEMVGLGPNEFETKDGYVLVASGAR